ncbi:unnamed protein product [Closterium sp. NIES-54]
MPVTELTCISPLKTVEQKDKCILILDLRKVNTNLIVPKFKYEGLSRVADLARVGDWIFSIDLKSRYHHIDIHPSCWNQLPHCLLLLLTLSRPEVLWSIMSLCLVLPRLFALFALVVRFLVRVLLLSPEPPLWHFVLPLFHCMFLCRLLLSPLFLHDPGSYLARAASPTVPRLLATVVTDPSFESTAASALVAELVDFAAACRLDYATALVVESESASPSSVGGEFALSTDVLEDRQEDFDCLATAVPHLAAMDAEMASLKSTGTYVDTLPPSGANIVDGMWIFRVKRPSGSPPAFKARYVAQGFNFLQGSLHEEISVRHPPGFTGSFPAGTEWSLRRPAYGLCQAPREWQDTLRTTLEAMGFTPSTSDPSLFLRTDTSLPPFYVLLYIDNLVFATVDTKALTFVKSELQKRHTCTDMGELCSSLGLQITRDRARCTITLTQSHMVHQVLQRFRFQFSSPQPTPLSTSHSLSAPPLDKSVEPSGPYPELVGCLMYLMTCTRRDLAYPLSLLARYVAPGMHRKVHWDAAKRVLRYLCSTSGTGLVLGGRGPVVLTGHADTSWVDDLATKWSLQGYTFSLGSGSVS